MSNSKEMFRFAQHGKIPCVIASVATKRIEHSNIFDCFGFTSQ